MDSMTLERLIKAEIPDAKVEVQDVKGNGAYFSAVVVSGQFKDMTRIEQHRKVHHAVDGFIGDGLHALKLVTRSA